MTPHLVLEVPHLVLTPHPAPLPRAEAERLRGEHRDAQSALSTLEDKVRIS